MRKFLASLVALVVLGVFAVPAHAQFKAGDYELTLSGGGSSDKSLSNTNFSANVGVGKFLTSDFELGLRQNVTFASSFAGSTAVFADYNFSFLDGKLAPFIGASAGYDYGRNVTGHWTGGPEVGVRYFVNPTTFLYTSATYQFDLNKGVSNGGFQYGVGIGFRF